MCLENIVAYEIEVSLDGILTLKVNLSFLSEGSFTKSHFEQLQQE